MLRSRRTIAAVAVLVLSACVARASLAYQSELTYGESGNRLTEALFEQYTYDEAGRLTRVRTDEQAQWQLENRDAAIQRDGLPPETSFVWDPATDRLVAIFETSESLLPGADGESALWRQYIHGDQAVDDPVEIGVRTADGSVKRFLPITNPLTGGSIEAVADTRGNLVERIVYADAWGDAPRYLHGPVVDRIRLNAKKTPEGGIAEVRFEVHLSEALSEATVAHGVRAVFSPSHAIGETAVETVAPVDGVLEDTNTVSITLTGAQWQELAASAAVVRVEVTGSLRTSAWGEASVMAAPSWARTALGVESSVQVPVSMPHDIAAINGFMASIASAKQDHRDAYTMSDLYLAADATSAAKLLTGYKSAPFVEPLTNMAFFRDRWYDPATGSWLTPDKRGYSEASNLYAAFGNDPVNRHDPLGLESAEIMQRHWAAYQQGFDPYYMRPMSDAILEGLSHPVVQGGMQVAGGCGAAAVGFYAIAQTGGAAAAPGYLAVGYGWDMCMAGVGTWATGETQQNLFVRGSNAALTGMGMDPEEAQWVTMGLDLAVGEFAVLGSYSRVAKTSLGPVSTGTEGLASGAPRVNLAAPRPSTPPPVVRPPRAVTRSNYASNFRAVSSTPAAPAAQVHHTLFQKYQAEFAARGINIHEMRFLRGVHPRVHSRITAKGARLERQLGRRLTVDEIFDLAARYDAEFRSSLIHRTKPPSANGGQ
jgi:RHS repeat-associated protein